MARRNKFRRTGTQHGNHANQRADRPVDTLHTTTAIPVARFQAPLHTLSRSPGASFIALAAARHPNLPATSCLGAFWTPAARARGAPRDADVQKPAQEPSFIRGAATGRKRPAALSYVRRARAGFSLPRKVGEGPGLATSGKSVQILPELPLAFTAAHVMALSHCRAASREDWRLKE